MKSSTVDKQRRFLQQCQLWVREQLPDEVKKKKKVAKAKKNKVKGCWEVGSV